MKHELDKQLTEKPLLKRTIRSFMRRKGRYSGLVEKAFAGYWPLHGIDLSAESNFVNSSPFFKSDIPLIIEIGFGNGYSLSHYAQNNLDTNFIGIEVYRTGVGQLLTQIEDFKLSNLKVIFADAVEVLKKDIPDKSLDAIHLLFPDPWPKARHHKRRLVSKHFIELMSEKLKDSGLFFMVTDWEPYAYWSLELLSQNPKFVNLSMDKKFVKQFLNRSMTKFEQRGERLGHEIFELAFKKL
ncbi:MAG: tRNA ((7)-)-methyltransferase [Francisellaceae bacterium]|nr:tRNA ((7)-)-methyltransferase [Francisellaceae bacterium]